MKSLLLVFSLFLSGFITDAGAQSIKELFSKGAKQRHLTTKQANLSGFTGKNGMLPDSIEHYSYDPFKKEYSLEPGSTTIYTYDQDGNEIETVSHSQGVNSTRYVNFYSNGKLIEDIRYSWNSATASWYPTDRYQVFSNQFGVDTAEVYSLYDTTGQAWIERDIYVYSIEYDANDRATYTTYKNYDALAQEWTIDQRVEFKYTGTDTIPSELYIAAWDGANWLDVFWVSRVKWGLGFSPNLDLTQPTLILGYEWDGADWLESYYDSSIVVDGHIEDYYVFNFDADSNYFVLGYSEHHRFDANGNEVNNVTLDWEFGLSDTSHWEINEIVYGVNGEIREWVNRWYSAVSGMEYRYKEVYYYANTALASVEKLKAIIYPNPLGSSQNLFIQSETAIQQVQLYSSNGALLRKWLAPNGDGLDIQGIAPGLYFIHLVDEAGNSSTQRLQIH